MDLAALADKMGEDQTLAALRFLNVLYEGAGNQTCITRLAEVTMQDPLDLGRVDLATYRGIQAPYNSGDYIQRRCQDIGRSLLFMEMERAVATDIEEFLKAADVRDLRLTGEGDDPRIVR